MAYVPQNIPQNEQNLQAPTGTTTATPYGNLPPTTGGSAGAATGGAGNPGFTQNKPAASKLSDYLTANAPNIPGEAQKIAGGLTQQYGNVTGDIGTAMQGFGSQVAGGYAPYNADLVGQAAQNPTQFVQNPENVKAFQQQFNDQYTGPQNFESTAPYSNIQNEVSNAVSNAGLVNTPTGLSTYLQNTGNGSTMPGIQTLDTALLTGNPEALGNILAAAKPFAGLTDYFGTKVNEANAQIPLAQQAANQTGENVRQQFTGAGGVIPTFQSNLNQSLEARRAAAPVEVQNAITAYESGQATPEQLTLLGIGGNDLQMQAAQNEYKAAQALKNDYGAPVNWGSIFSQNAPEVVYNTPGTVATPDDIAKAQALSLLTGQDLGSFLGSTQPGGPLVNPNLQALNELGTNLTGRDESQIFNDVNQYFLGRSGQPFSTTGNYQDFYDWFMRSPVAIPSGGSSADNTLMDIVRTPVSVVPGMGGGGGDYQQQLDYSLAAKAPIIQGLINAYAGQDQTRLINALTRAGLSPEQLKNAEAGTGGGIIKAS